MHAMTKAADPGIAPPWASGNDPSGAEPGRSGDARYRVKVLGLDGRVLFVSSCGREILLSPDDRPGSGQIWWDLWPPAMRRRVRCAFDRAADDATIVLRGRCPARDGVMRDWKITLRGVLGARGKVKTVLASAQVVA